MSFVIRLMRIDFKRPVNLLQQNHPHELMWKGHPGEAQLIFRPIKNLRCKP